MRDLEVLIEVNERAVDAALLEHKRRKLAARKRRAQERQDQLADAWPNWSGDENS